MHIFKKIENDIKVIVETLQAEKKLPDAPTDKIEAMPPKDASHGDISTNAAMVLAAATKKNPREIATLLLDPVKKLPHVVSAEIAGPGFINITFAPALWQGMVSDILKEGLNYGASNMGAGQKINVEYVSANPTGPMHVGHARYIYGDALATLLVKAGYDVTREYYINDAGAQVEKVADSAYLRYREACGETIGEIPEGLYPGDYLIPIGQGLKEKFGTSLLGKDRNEWFKHVRDYALVQIMDMIKGDLKAIGITFDRFTSEQALRDAGKVDSALATLEKQGLIYVGTLEPPKGKIPDDFEARPQTLFRSTQFGDDSDRPVKKSNGEWTYFAPDIAYQLDKIERGFDKLVMLLGVDHGGYVKRLKAAVTALSGGKATLEVKLCALVKFMRGGEPLKMSKRAGTFVTVREVVDEVGKDVFRFIMLTRKNDMPLDFDFEKVMEQSKDNPVFYVQYAHARAHSIMRNAKAELPEAAAMAAAKKAPLEKLSHPEELALIRRMCSFPRAVESAAAALEPHRIAFWLHDLAAAFHGLWNLGNDDLGLRFIVKSDIELTAARITLAEALAQVIASGLTVLGVKPLEEMR